VKCKANQIRPEGKNGVSCNVPHILFIRRMCDSNIRKYYQMYVVVKITYNGERNTRIRGFKLINVPNYTLNYIGTQNSHK